MSLTYSRIRLKSIPLNGRRGTGAAHMRLYTARAKLPALRPISGVEPTATGKLRLRHTKVVYETEMWEGP